MKSVPQRCQHNSYEARFKRALGLSPEVDIEVMLEVLNGHLRVIAGVHEGEDLFDGLAAAGAARNCLQKLHDLMAEERLCPMFIPERGHENRSQCSLATEAKRRLSDEWIHVDEIRRISSLRRDIDVREWLAYARKCTIIIGALLNYAGFRSETGSLKEEEKLAWLLLRTLEPLIKGYLVNTNTEESSDDD